MGGVVATGTAGPRRFRYGTPRDLLIGLTVVRADGVIAHSGGKVVKNVAGDDIGKLFSGSQGTLGLITEATFRLHPRPAAVAWVTGEFGPSERVSAAAAVAEAAGSALVPSAVELDWPGGSAAGAAGRGAAGRHVVRGRRTGQADVRAAGVRGRNRWSVPRRRPRGGALLPSSSAVVRASFWVSALGAVLEALAAAAADAGVRPAVSGPAGAGVLYACLDPGTSEDAAARFVAVLRERIGGVPEALGARGSVVVLAAPPPVLAAVPRTGTIPGAALMRAVKDQFDPDHRMFPGRFMEGD